MFAVCMVIIVYRKLIAELEEYCSNNGGLEKKFKYVPFSDMDHFAVAC